MRIDNPDAQSGEFLPGHLYRVPGRVIERAQMGRKCDAKDVGSALTGPAEKLQTFGRRSGGSSERVGVLKKELIGLGGGNVNPIAVDFAANVKIYRDDINVVFFSQLAIEAGDAIGDNRYV